MIKVYSKALDQSMYAERLIGKIENDAGPTLIFTGGIHGNEPSGVFALSRIIDKIKDEDIPLNGSLYAICGNMQALQTDRRYIKEDLNRIWTEERIETIRLNGKATSHEEMQEQKAIYHIIQEILQNKTGPFYFFDLHTTSSATLPFLTVNDSMINRKFVTQYPLPIILGLEEYLEGPILSYINELGYVAFGFEGGQHDSLAAIENHMAFIATTLVMTECVHPEAINFNHHYNALAKTSGDVRHIYEIYFRFRIRDGEPFEMLPGFRNFQRVTKNQAVAQSKGRTVRALQNGRIFMPLYQKEGQDGFFAIRRIPSIFLALSALFRKYRLDKLLVGLPGVKWADESKSALKVDRRIASILTKQIFHLLGYRSKKLDKHYYIMKNRERKSRNEDYWQTKWYQ